MSSKPVALITGACSGMGEAFVLDLVSKGWQVAMFDIQANADLQSKVGDAATSYKCDVSDYDQQAECFQKVWDTYGRLDLVCLNAGIFDRSSLFILNQRNSDTIPPKPNLLCTDVNVKGVMYGTQLATHFMRKNKIPGGNIVVTSSASSHYPHYAIPEYSASKAAVWMFVRAAAKALKSKDNIRLNSIRPGFVPTSLAPPKMIEAVGKQYITPVPTIVAALHKIIDDESLSGVALECSLDKIILTPEPEFLNGKASQRACFVWDPFFESLHGETSGFADGPP